LIVAPLSVLGVWESEFRKFAAFPYTLAVLTGTGTQKEQTLKRLTGTGLLIAVCNYEFARDKQKAVLAWRPDLVICDEGHKLKSHTSQTSKALHTIGAAAKYKLLLTGTPVTNKAADIFSQYKFLNPRVFGTSYYAFRNRYFDQGYFASQLTMKPHMEPEFTQRLHSIAYRATKAECLDLPAFVDVVRPVELELAAMKVYKDLFRDSFAEIGDDTVTAANILARLLRLSQLTGGFVRGDDGAMQHVSKAKLAALEDIVEEAVSEERKLVIIARFVPELAAICKLLEAKQIGHVLVKGGVKNRATLVEQFQTDPETQVFVGQIGTAGLGITLHAASTLVFYSLDYSMSNFEQTKARIHRSGQHHNCTYIYLTARGTVDENILQALRDKGNLARALIDDYRNGGFDGKQNV
jgi:SNF2 family DNA or RNA helicase